MQSAFRPLLGAMALTFVLAAMPAPGSATEGSPPVDINTASAAELASLPGIGESKAKAIIEHRAVDPFKTVDDLKKVKGIGDKMLESLRPSLTVGKSPATAQ